MLPTGPSLCMHLCMATRTLSVDEEAYRRLVGARSHPRESFSKVIKRARWGDGQKRCGQLLEKVGGVLTEEQIQRLERAQREDQPPPDPWNR